MNALEGQSVPALKGLSHPMYSPGGRWLAAYLLRKNILVKTPLSGGAPIPIAPAIMPFRGEWGADGHVSRTNTLTGGIVRVPENGGAAEPVTELNLENQERVRRYVRLLPGGKGLVCAVAAGDIDTFDGARASMSSI
jgi:hypothetical protein